MYSIGTGEREPSLEARVAQMQTGRGSTLLNASHAGLVFVGRDGERMAWHTDEMTTVERKFPAFPVNTSGNPLMNMETGAEITPELYNTLFDSFWLTPDTLEAQGFHVERSFPLVHSGENGYGQINGGNDITSRYVDFGRYGGYWRTSAADTDPTQGAHPDIPAYLRIHQTTTGANIGSYRIFMDPFCYENGIHFNTIVGTQISEIAVRELGLSPSLVPDWSMRASRIAFAYGGCAAMGTSVTRQGTFPVNGWRD